MENPHKKQFEELGYWVFQNHGKTVDLTTISNFGYLGYANGMSMCEWACVDVAKSIIKKSGGDWHDYLGYDVDSSD